MLCHFFFLYTPTFFSEIQFVTLLNAFDSFYLILRQLWWVMNCLTHLKIGCIYELIIFLQLLNMTTEDSWRQEELCCVPPPTSFSSELIHSVRFWRMFFLGVFFFFPVILLYKIQEQIGNKFFLSEQVIL